MEYGQTVGIYQTLIVPNYTIGEVQLFHRLSTGKRGRAEAWENVSRETYETPVHKTPVAVRLTDNDHFAIQGGKVTILGYKASNASDALPITDLGIDHMSMVQDLVARFEASDQTLSEYLTDGRYKDSHIDFPPLVPNRAYSRVTVDNSPVTHERVQVMERTHVHSAPVEMATVPDIKWAKEYINRKVNGDLTEFAIFDVAMKRNQNVLITGHAGAGKTSAVMAYASARGYRYYNFSCSAGTDTKALFGGWNPNPNYGLNGEAQFIWQDGAVTDMVRNGGVLLIGEVTFIPERLSAELHSLLDYRREIQLKDKDGEVVKAHPDLLIVADGNIGYRGTRPLPEAFNDRFDHRLDFPYDPEIEAKLIKNKAVLEMANSLRDRFEQDEIATPVSTRGLVAFMQNMADLGIDYAIYAYLNRFQQHEQASIKLVLDTFRYNIEEASGIAKPIINESASEVM
jgi:MoxR-like ATPase